LGLLFKEKILIFEDQYVIPINERFWDEKSLRGGFVENAGETPYSGLLAWNKPDCRNVAIAFLYFNFIIKIQKKEKTAYWIINGRI